MGNQEHVHKLGCRTNQDIQKSYLNLERLTGHPNNEYTQEQKNNLRDYIHCFSNGDLEYNEQNCKFTINNDTELRLLLFGMQMRLYKQPLSDETQVATSTTSIRNII